jgi:3-deoxy-manno-octulosonate cytidylyltransferase (CMP-KDO synthetase)
MHSPEMTGRVPLFPLRQSILISPIALTSIPARRLNKEVLAVSAVPSAVIVLPARYASSRLPGKPLLCETGKYLIQHVYEAAAQARLAQEVIVATDDPRIQSAVRSFGGSVMLTDPGHPSGTDRVAEVARVIPADLFVNLQGDEPLIDPASLDLLISLLAGDPEADMATLAAPLANLEQYHSPHCVKVVCDDAGRALYFSRSPIPFVRDGQPDLEARPARFLQHIGLYAYRRSFLLRLAGLPPHPLETIEKLEQLRALAHGCRMPVGLIERPTLGVDTREDYDRFVAFQRRLESGQAA